MLLRFLLLTNVFLFILQKKDISCLSRTDGFVWIVFSLLLVFLVLLKLKIQLNLKVDLKIFLMILILLENHLRSLIRKCLKFLKNMVSWVISNRFLVNQWLFVFRRLINFCTVIRRFHTNFMQISLFHCGRKLLCGKNFLLMVNTIK